MAIHIGTDCWCNHLNDINNPIFFILNLSLRKQNKIKEYKIELNWGTDVIFEFSHLYYFNLFPFSVCLMLIYELVQNIMWREWQCNNGVAAAVDDYAWDWETVLPAYECGIQEIKTHLMCF